MLNEFHNSYSQCLNLWASVIIQAIEDYRKGSLAEKRDAAKFFKGDCFDTICELFDINSKTFKNKILKRKINYMIFHGKQRTALCFQCGQRFEIAKMKKLAYNIYVCTECK